MPYCTASGCKNASGKPGCPTGLSWHSYPLAPERKQLLEQWIHNVGRDNFHPTKTSKLCSEHFREDCFVKDMFEKITGQKKGTRKRTSLVAECVPTVFQQRALLSSGQDKINRLQKRKQKGVSRFKFDSFYK